MNGRRIYHARGKVLGGSSSINGMIFQRGNPLDYERWAADPGMESWGYAHCLPYFKRMEDCTAAPPDDAFRGHGGPLGLERGPATSPLFEAFFEACRQAGHVVHDDVNGVRQEGFSKFDRNIRRGRRLSAARAYLHPVMGRPNLEVRTRVQVARRPARGHARGRGRDDEGRADRGRRGDPLRGRDQLAAAAAALRHRRPGASAGRGRPARARAARGGREPAGPPRGVRPVRVRAAGLDAARARQVARALDRLPVALLPQGPGGDEPLRGGRLHPLERRRGLPEPDVPLPPARDPLRRHQARGRARLPAARGADVLGCPRLDPASAAPTRPPSRRCSSTTSRPTRTGASGWRRSARTREIMEEPALAPFNAGEVVTRARACRRTRRSSTGCAPTPRPRCTPRAPAGWAWTSCRWSTR